LNLDCTDGLKRTRAMETISNRSDTHQTRCPIHSFIAGWLHFF
jgi:hypothetical protein